MDIITELFKPIQCYACFVHCKHLCNECPTRYNPICSNCSRTGHSYTDCDNNPKCCNCLGSHLATARIYPAYHTAIETLKPKIAAQLVHYTHNTHPDATLTPNNISGTEIFRTAAIASKTTEEFLLSLFNSCKTFNEPSQQDNQNAQQELTHDSQIDIDNTSITAIQTHTQDTQTQIPQGLTQTHTQLQTQKPQGQTHTTHETSITAIQTHTQDSVILWDHTSHHSDFVGLYRPPIENFQKNKNFQIQNFQKKSKFSIKLKILKKF